MNNHLFFKKGVCKLFTALGLMLIAAVSFAGEVMVQLSPRTLVAGESGQLHLVSRDGMPELEEQLPKVKGIVWAAGPGMTKQVSYNGNVFYTKAYNFNVTEPGTIKIPSFTVRVGGEKVLSDPVEVKAVKNKMTEFVYAKVKNLTGRNEVYVGEEMYFKIDLYSLRNIAFQPTQYPVINLDNVIFKNFSKVNRDSDKFSPYRKEMKTVDGKEYIVYSTITAFRPISQGVLNPSVFIAGAYRVQKQRRGAFDDDDPFSGFGFSDPFSRYRNQAYTVSAVMPEIKVEDLPEEPEGTEFLGLIGVWQVKTELLSDKFKAGEPVTLKLFIKGQGSLETLKAPELEIPNVRFYPPEVEKEIFCEDGTQKAEIKYVMIPLKQGPLDVKLDVSVFNCRSGKYQSFPFEQKIEVAKSDGIIQPGAVFVDSTKRDSGYASLASSKDESRSRPSGVLYLKRTSGSDVRVPLWENHWFLMLVLFLAGPFIWGMSEFFYYRKLKLNNDPLLRKRLSAQGRKGRIMKKLANASDDELEQVVRTEVVPYLNDLLSYPPGTTAAELAGKLKDRELAGCLEQVEASSYMPGGSSNNRELKAKMLKQLKKVTVLVLMLSLSFNAFAADDKKDAKETKQPATPVVEKEKKAGLDSGKIETTAQALTAYDSGDFRRAADYFRGLINPMEPSASTLYNLGNCYYQLGDWGKALVCFERARRLAPMDSDIFENMNLVRRKLFLPEVGAAKNPLELLLNLRDDLRPDQWMLFIGLGWLLCGLALGLRHYVRYSRWFVPLLVGMVIIVVGLVSVISQYGTTYSCDTAVITGRNVPVYSLPSEKSGKTDLKLRDGEEVQVEERRMDWVRVRADNAEGWIHSSELACLWGDWKTLP